MRSVKIVRVRRRVEPTGKGHRTEGFNLTDSGPSKLNHTERVIGVEWFLHDPDDLHAMVTIEITD